MRAASKAGQLCLSAFSQLVLNSTQLTGCVLLLPSSAGVAVAAPWR
jgi:hypothetical protein